MQMNFDSLSDIRKTTIDFCASLDGPAKTELIEGIFEDYETTVSMQSPRHIRGHYRELLTTLVKNFGH
jgi:hypothetical protein